MLKVLLWVPLGSGCYASPGVFTGDACELRHGGNLDGVLQNLITNWGLLGGLNSLWRLNWRLSLKAK